MDDIVRNATPPEGRTVPAQPVKPGEAVPTPALVTPVAATAPAIGPLLNEAQARVMLEYLAADYGVPMKFDVRYTDMLNGFCSPLVRAQSGATSALNSYGLSHGFFQHLNAGYGQNTNVSADGLQCQSVQDLSNIIAVALLTTPLNTRAQLREYLQEHGVLDRSDQLELPLPSVESAAKETAAPIAEEQLTLDLPSTTVDSVAQRQQLGTTVHGRFGG